MFVKNVTILKYLLLSFTNSLLRLTEQCQEIPVQVKNKTTTLFQGLETVCLQRYQPNTCSRLTTKTPHQPADSVKR